jgi:hypothetical protein
MRILVLFLIAYATCCAGPARAADLSGVWGVDRRAWDQQLDRIIAGMLGRLPPEAIAQIRADGADPTAGLREAASRDLDDTIEFLPGGVVRTRSARNGVSDDGRWSVTGDLVRIEVTDADGFQAMTGAVEGDRIALRPILADNHHDAGLLRQMVYPLVRRR